MSPPIRDAVRRLGWSGTIVVAGFPLFLLFAFLGLNGWATLTACVLFIPTVRLSLRVFRRMRGHALWSLRNRLLLVYGLLGALPVLLFLTLVGFSLWAFMSELAVYLAGNALDRYLANVRIATEVLKPEPMDKRLAVAGELFKHFRAAIPNYCLIVRDGSGIHRFPDTAPSLQGSEAWPSVHGLLVLDGHFCAWSHLVDGGQQIDSLAPVDDQVMRNLAPNLGAISLFEVKDDSDVGKGNPVAYTGTFDPSDLDDKKVQSGGGVGRTHGLALPTPISRFDIPVFTPASRPHYHLNSPNKVYSGVLMVVSRPSAVFQSLFSGSERIREILFDALIAIGVLFGVLEAIAIWIGVSLSRKITRAVNQLYEGTRRVIRGDFHHRIKVTDADQLGELTQSFNQMTGNLERLLLVEKEKERLQTELEIAREVQGQLYPKAAPPFYGLRLTVRCDPARMVSGDYYDYQDLGAGKLVFALGDVAGKGISAALLMATIQASLRAQITSYAPMHPNECTIRPEVDTASLVSRLNRQVHAHTSPEKYATFFFAVFDEKTRTLTYTNAGHLPPILFRNGATNVLDSNGTVVGIFPGAKYDESCLELQPDDLLVCYTDGITEPENEFGEMFGEERLIELVHKYKDRDDGEILDLILEAVRAWTGIPELSDDMTLLLARPVHVSA